MSLLPVSGEFLLDFPSPRHLSSSGSYPLDLSGLGDPSGSNATTGLTLRVTGTHKPFYHGKVEILTRGVILLEGINLLHDERGDECYITTKERLFTHWMKPIQNADVRFLEAVAGYRMSDYKRVRY
jgi:hypothetical protein